MTTLSTLLTIHGPGVARLAGLWGRFALSASLVYYERSASRDREKDVAPGLERLAQVLEDDGWDLERVTAGEGRDAPLDFLRVTGFTCQRTDVDPWDDTRWQARERRLRREREERARRTGAAGDAKMLGAMMRHRAAYPGGWAVEEGADEL